MINKLQMKIKSYERHKGIVNRKAILGSDDLSECSEDELKVYLNYLKNPDENSVTGRIPDDDKEELVNTGICNSLPSVIKDKTVILKDYLQKFNKGQTEEAVVKGKVEVSDFITNRCIIEDWRSVSQLCLYMSYQQFCDEYNVKPEGLVKFNKLIKNKYAEYEYECIVHDEPIKVWKGIDCKECMNAV